MRPDGERRFFKRSALPADEPCAECRVSNDKVWLLADTLNPNLDPAPLHYHLCAPAWFDHAASDAAAAGDAVAPATNAPKPGDVFTFDPPATGIPFMITNEMKTRLTTLNFTTGEINEMTPATAHAILARAEAALAAVAPPSPATASLSPTNAPDACARCPHPGGTLVPYHFRTHEKDGEVFLDLWEGDGPGAVKLHISCSPAWHRAEAKRRGLRLGYFARPS